MTFLEHLKELQMRFFVVALAFLALAAVAFPYFDKIVTILVAPLGDTQKLVYLTPGGAFNFMIQVCLFVGLIGALPVFIYNLYRFIMPAVTKTHWQTALGYTLASLGLAIAGVVFSYYIMLPAAIHFLTSFNLYHIDAMLTVDSYFSFVMAYVGVAALLFQIPLIMLLINGATPLKPGKLMSHQGNIILVSFIIAAIVSPTPDALNQTILASPMVVMYQVGIVLVWLKNHKKKASAPKKAKAVVYSAQAQPVAAFIEPAVKPCAVNALTKAPIAAKPLMPRSLSTVDGFVTAPRRAMRSFQPSITVPPRIIPKSPRASDFSRDLPNSSRSLDGVSIIYT